MSSFGTNHNYRKVVQVLGQKGRCTREKLAEELGTQSGGTLDTRHYRQWLGFSFERFCRHNAMAIAERLGFSAVQFRSGSYFRRGNVAEFGAQVDLLFDRADKVYTVCEVKYQDAPVGVEVIPQVERKIESLPTSRNRSIQKVLICGSGKSPALRQRHYFDRVLGLADLI